MFFKASSLKKIRPITLIVWVLARNEKNCQKHGRKNVKNFFLFYTNKKVCHMFFKDFSKILFLDLKLFRQKKFWAIFEIFFTQTVLFTATYPTYALIKIIFLQNERTKKLS